MSRTSIRTNNNHTAASVILPHYDFEPFIIFEALTRYENNKKILQDDVFKIIRLYMKHYNKVFDLTPVGDTSVTHLLKKYHIEMHPENYMSVTMPRIMYTYALITFTMIKKNYCQPLVDITEMYDFFGFEPEYRTAAIFAIIPHGQNYGGFIKALLHYLYLETEIVFKNEVENKSEADVMQELITFAKTVYHTPLIRQPVKLRFMEKHPITFAMCQQWHNVFDAKYPIHVNIHMDAFGQIS